MNTDVKKVVNNKKFTVYDNEAKTVLELLNKLGEYTNNVVDELNNKTDLMGDHKGSWQGLSKPTMSEEGMRATVEKIVEKDIPSIKEQMDNNIQNLNVLNRNQISLFEKKYVDIFTRDGHWGNAINQAIIDAKNKKLEIPYGEYPTNVKVKIGNTVDLIANGAIIKPSSEVLIGVEIGDITQPSRINIDSLRVDRGAFNSVTENIGMLFMECNQCTFLNLESRFSKYNYIFQPSLYGFAYNTFINPQAVGGYINFLFNALGTGFANENSFFGGRGFCTANTDTNLKIADSEGENNHNKFYGVSLEGQGEQAIYVGDSWNLFDQCRTEGTWKSGFACVIATSALGTFIRSSRYDFTVKDNGDKSMIYTYVDGIKVSTNINDKITGTFIREGANTGDNPVIQIHDLYSSSGNSYGLEFIHGREGDNSYLFKCIRKSDGLVRSSLTTDGRFTVAQSLKSEQSGWNFSPLTLGKYTLWIDLSGRLRLKKGTPISDTDGTIVGLQE